MSVDMPTSSWFSLAFRDPSSSAGMKVEPVHIDIYAVFSDRQFNRSWQFMQVFINVDKIDPRTARTPSTMVPVYCLGTLFIPVP
jgi:hypothetical protein